ncbi:MAG: hypothetical protein ACFFER_17660 [Candidatus Thorarchaeota archaeon]
MKAFTVNIGVNTATDPIRRSGPIYPNGTFDYIPIPWDSGITYDEIGLASAFRRMGIEDRLDNGVHHDPEFIGFTYGTRPEDWPNVSNLKQIERGDLLVFFGSLERTPHELLGESFLPWIADSRGMYIMGLFEMDGILTRDGELFESKLGKKAYSSSAHFEYFEHNPEDTSWIFKGSPKSSLLPVAVPVKRKEFETLFDQSLPKKSKQSETALVSSYMRTARQVVNFPYLITLISAYCPSAWR